MQTEDIIIAGSRNEQERRKERCRKSEDKVRLTYTKTDTNIGRMDRGWIETEREREREKEREKESYREDRY